MNQRDMELKEKSGGISTTDPLAIFLYVLIKDYLPATHLEGALDKVKGLMPGMIMLNNGWLGKYALELKDQIDKLREEQAVGKINFPVSDKHGTGVISIGISPKNGSGGISVDSDGKTHYWSDSYVKSGPAPVMILSEADVVMNRIKTTLSEEEYERIKQDVQEFEQAFGNITKESK